MKGEIVDQLLERDTHLVFRQEIRELSGREAAKLLVPALPQRPFVVRMCQIVFELFDFAGEEGVSCAFRCEYLGRRLSPRLFGKRKLDRASAFGGVHP